MAFNVGDKVLAVFGPRNTMNPDRRNVGQVGEVVCVAGNICGMPHYQVRFNWGDDYIDECNLEAA